MAEKYYVIINIQLSAAGCQSIGALKGLCWKCLAGFLYTQHQLCFCTWEHLQGPTYNKICCS